MRAAVVSSRQQLNRLNSVERDRGAADKSTESVRSRDPGQRERGSRRSGERFLCRFLLARRRRSAGLSQFVERYRRVGRPVSVLPVLQIICRKCSTRAFTAFSVSELVGADNEGPTPPTEPNFHSERKQHHEPQKNHRYPARSPHAARPHRLRRGHDVSRAGRKRPRRRSRSTHDRKQPVPRRHGMCLCAEQLAGERRDRHQRSRGKRRRRLRRGLRRADRAHPRRPA